MGELTDDYGVDFLHSLPPGSVVRGFVPLMETHGGLRDFSKTGPGTWDSVVGEGLTSEFLIDTLDVIVTEVLYYGTFNEAYLADLQEAPKGTRIVSNGNKVYRHTGDGVWAYLDPCTHTYQNVDVEYFNISQGIEVTHRVLNWGEPRG